MKQPVERRLAAILAADVAGYSRLMGVDEEGTLDRLKALRRKLFDPKFAEHRGRLVKTTGDGLLVEFSSVVDAVRCAVELQRAMIDRNAGIPEDGRITLRIGINLGDVIIDGEDIYGDSVNIAAARSTGRTWRRLYLACGAEPNPGQALLHLRGYGGAERQEHCTAGARL